VKLSAEFLILFVATIAIAGFVASQVMPMIAQQSQTADAIISGVSLYSNKWLFFNVRNTGSKDITQVKADVYRSDGTLLGTYGPVGTSIPPGSERAFSGQIANAPTVGQRYTIVVTVTFSDGSTKSYPTTVIALSA